MEITGITSVTAITVICYLIAQAVKVLHIDNKWFPVICGFTGALLGMGGMFVMADFPSDDILTSLAVGAVRGFAAAGVNQVLLIRRKNRCR